MRVLAVDGGQSAVRVRHSEGDGVAEVGGVSRQEGDTVGAAAAAVVAGWHATGALPVDRAVLGLTTAPSDDVSRRRLCAAVAEGTGAREVWLADDAVTAHAGALSLDWGVSVTVGTGVACLAMSRDGEARVIGGHGFLLGDEGGAFWIGREGLRAALRAADGRGSPTALSDAAARRFGGLADLAERLHSASRPVNDIAHFAPDVLDAAAAGDPIAGAVAAGASAELVTLVRAGVAAAGDGTVDRPVPVALGGRLLAPGTSLRVRLDAALAHEVPAAVARSADGSPLDGAVLLGMAAGPGRYEHLVSTWRSAA
jgi:N-acetylglucosamine kinase-like BadF-type ATPase